LTRTDVPLGRPSPIEYVARHFANRAPSARYSEKRSRSPSSPSVTVSSLEAGQRLGAAVDLDPGDHPPAGEQLRERRAVGGPLPDRLVEEDDAADERLDPRRGEEQLAVRAARRLGRVDADLREAPGDRAGALVGGEDALAGSDELAGGGVQQVHGVPSPGRCACRLPPAGDRRIGVRADWICGFPAARSVSSPTAGSCSTGNVRRAQETGRQ
jgi:hypothetical protein